MAPGKAIRFRVRTATDRGGTSRSHISNSVGAVGREGLVHLIPVLTPEYLFPSQWVPVLAPTYLLPQSRVGGIDAHTEPKYDIKPIPYVMLHPL